MPLAGETLFLVGRIQGLTRRRLDMLVKLREGKLATRPGRTIIILNARKLLSSTERLALGAIEGAR